MEGVGRIRAPFWHKFEKNRSRTKTPHSFIAIVAARSQIEMADDKKDGLKRRKWDAMWTGMAGFNFCSRPSILSGRVPSVRPLLLFVSTRRLHRSERKTEREEKPNQILGALGAAMMPRSANLVTLERKCQQATSDLFQSVIHTHKFHCSKRC